MSCLTIEHDDFKLRFECVSLSGILNRAQLNIDATFLNSVYTASSEVKLSYNDSKLKLVNETQPAFFFDNADYAVWVDFTIAPDECKVSTMRINEQEQFSYHREKGILSGFLNFGNDIGKSEFSIRYNVAGELKTFRFGFDVLSSKLNYHKHWKSIITDIESEYRMLSLDFLRRTYHSFRHDSHGETPEIIWWNLFKQEQNTFIKACRFILERPRRRIFPATEHLKAIHLKHLTPQLENELTEHKYNESHRYRCEKKVFSHDTPENRFLKHALFSITCKHGELSKRILTNYSNLSAIAVEEIKEIGKTLNALCSHQFFRTVGAFKTMHQESLVLQRASGYAAIARVYAILRATYALKEGIYRLETKDIATLYEIWCFIELKNTVQKLYGEEVNIEHVNRQELSGHFAYNLKCGEKSRIVFKGKDGIELATLSSNNRINNATCATDYNIVAPSGVTQKPDIILQLTKPLGVDDTFKLTYLFDAKYRIADKTESGVDTPPDDAINQMHRYRDAIYYSSQKDSQRLHKEVIGGYILFPGTGEPLKIQQSYFYKSIEQVNIGAFPLRPHDAENRTLLENFISGLMSKDIRTLLKKTIPQKGMALKMADTLDESVFLRDAPVKFIQDSAVKESVYPIVVEKCSSPELIEWIPLSLSDRPVRLLKVEGYLGSFTWEYICNKYPAFNRVTDVYDGKLLHLWKVKEVK